MRTFVPQLRSVRRVVSRSSSFAPILEALEERALPSSTGVITSNFNGTAVSAGSSIWFNSVVKVSGVGSAGATVHVDHSTIDYTVGGVTTRWPCRTRP